jgi:hypothetical protein
VCFCYTTGTLLKNWRIIRVTLPCLLIDNQMCCCCTNDPVK